MTTTTENGNITNVIGTRPRAKLYTYIAVSRREGGGIKERAEPVF